MLENGTASPRGHRHRHEGRLQLPDGPAARCSTSSASTRRSAILDALYDEFRDPNYAAVPLLRRMVSGRPARPQVRPGLLRLPVAIRRCLAAQGRTAPCRSSRRPPAGSSRRRRRRRPTASSASAPTSSRARCWPPTGRGSSRCRSARRRPGLVVARPAGRAPPRRAAGRRSLRRSVRRYEVRVDTAFRDGDRGLRRPAPAGRLDQPGRSSPPTPRLHQLGWAHSVEAWTPDGRLVGGLYGVAIGGLFAGESMFHRPHRRLEGGAGRPGRAPARRRERAARRAVADRPPGLARRRRGAPTEVPGAARPRHGIGGGAGPRRARSPFAPDLVAPGRGRTGLAGSEPGLGD